MPEAGVGVVHFVFGPRGSMVSGRHRKSEAGSLAGARLASDLFAAAAVSSQDCFVSNVDAVVVASRHSPDLRGRSSHNTHAHSA